MSQEGLRRLKVLVIDDSARSREAVVEALRALPAIEVVGIAVDGEEGLARCLQLQPDLITVDLEMPKMDGFTFLRMVMARAPTPVLVVSSYARKENVFRALELGAVDFIPKPGGADAGSAVALQALLAEKIEIARSLRRANLRAVAPATPERTPRPAAARQRPEERKQTECPRVIAIGASTGGPPALQHILSSLPADFPAAVVVAQHMPERFTEAFAARLDRTCEVEVREAADGDLLLPGRVLLAPGGKQMSVSLVEGQARAKVGPAADGSTYVPSVDELFLSVAALCADRAMGLILTGMGRDGREGIIMLKKAGGTTVAESEETAIVHGMPKEAADTGCVDRVLPLEEITAAILAFARTGRLPASGSR
ncbi:MAG: chemotaxis response regulator protein-glutamate methylesterase [Deltaproteobacteria bacterium]|nr:chemotaxis response regulator protein-glutamate methylesterase [Deltaproteobacteria bacterium]